MTDALLLACTLSDWQGDISRCRWCDFGLRGRQRRWCSTECQERARENHCWWAARPAALARDGQRCARCGVRKLRKVGARLVRTRLDVHHKRKLGKREKRAEVGCHHHLDNLTTLCGGSGSCHHAEHYGTPADQLNLKAVAA